MTDQLMLGILAIGVVVMFALVIVFWEATQ